jgi:hypothetical protein
MKSLLDTRRPLALLSGAAPAPSTRGRERAGNASDVRFVPARWLALLLGIATAVLSGRTIPKLGLIGLVWSFTPKAAKIAIGLLAAVWMIVVIGALAAIALLVLQIS